MRFEATQPVFRKVFTITVNPYTPDISIRSRRDFIVPFRRVRSKGEIVITNLEIWDNNWSNPDIPDDGIVDLSEYYRGIESGRGKVISREPGHYPAYQDGDDDSNPSALCRGVLLKVIGISDIVAEYNDKSFRFGYAVVEEMAPGSH